MQAREHCERTSAVQRPSHTRALIHILADWAAKNRAMIDIVKLPFDSLEEQVHVSCRATSGPPYPSDGQQIAALCMHAKGDFGRGSCLFA